MRAVTFLGRGQVEIVDRPRPTAPPGWVVLQVLAAGVCQTDVHLRRGTDSRIAPGLVLGHEIAGAVVELGLGVSGWEVGQSAVVYPVWSCLSCPACQQGRRNACQRTVGRGTSPTTPGISADGGMAEYVAVPASALADTGGLDPAVAATMTDAGLSPYGAIKTAAPQLAPGTTAVVIGLGGLGRMALQELRALTAAHVIALDVDDRALAAARQWSDHVSSPAVEDIAAKILGWTGGFGATAIFDFVGSDATLALAADVVAPFGAVLVTGMGGGQINLRADAGSRLPRGATIAPRMFSGSFPDLLEVLALAEQGALQPTLTRFPFSDALTALDALAAGEVGGRAVLEF